MGKVSSFSAEVKEELARIYPEKPCCCMAELSALARLDGAVTIERGEGIGLSIATDYSAVARKVYRLLKDLFSLEATLSVKRKNQLKPHTLYCIRIAPSEETLTLLQTLGILSLRRQILPGVKKDLVRNKCCRRSYLRGAFLGGGSVSSPGSDYHLEFSAGNEKLGLDLTGLINRSPGLTAKLSRRKQSCLAYVKESSQIADLLAFMGAHGSLLEFENARVLRGMKNQVNRLVNCETANLDKTVDAAARRMSQIRRVEREIGLDAIDPSLASIARLRLDYPEANLKELGELMTPPLGKSGVNHRLRRIAGIADGLGEESETAPPRQRQ